ncbi:MAG: hypothetical protein EXR28_16055 [Betaproteobacteria bacterium]|nr:hypothetical protein [Betaproteobacteria bacterium]
MPHTLTVALIGLLASLIAPVPQVFAAAADGYFKAGSANAFPPVTLAQAAAPGKPSPRKLRGAYVTSLSFSPLFLAIEKGHFLAESIDMEIQVVQSAADAVAFVGLGQLDVAFGNISDTFFNAISRNVDIKIVGGLSYAPRDSNALSPTPIFVRKELADSGAVKTMADFKGRKIALNARGGIVEYQVSQSLRRLGLAIKDVQIETMPFPDMLVAMTKGAVDGAIVPEPIATAARERNIGVVVDPNPAPGIVVTTVMFGKNLLANAETPVANAVMRALRRAANELQSPEAIMSRENVPIWSKYTKLPPEIVAKTRPYIFARDLALDVDNMLEQQKFLAEGGRIAAQLPAERLIDSRFVIRMR